MNPSSTLVEIAKSGQQELSMYKQAQNVAGLCKDIVVKKAIEIEGRKFVPVEAWTTIAVAHTCIATIKEDSVVPVYDRSDKLLGIRAIAEVRRQTDGQVLTSAEGFVGTDEVVWYGGVGKRWNRVKRCKEDHLYEKRPDYAIRAMAQTRAVSRACRTAFSHVVVLMDAGLETVPYEEVATDVAEDRGDTGNEGSIDKAQQEEKARKEREMLAKNEHSEKNVTQSALPAAETSRQEPPANTGSDPLRDQFRGGKWKAVVIGFGEKYKGKSLGSLTEAQLKGWLQWQPKAFGSKPITEDDKILRAALDVANQEAFA